MVSILRRPLGPIVTILILDILGATVFAQSAGYWQLQRESLRQQQELRDREAQQRREHLERQSQLQAERARQQQESINRQQEAQAQYFERLRQQREADQIFRQQQADQQSATLRMLQQQLQTQDQEYEMDQQRRREQQEERRLARQRQFDQIISEPIDLPARRQSTHPAPAEVQHQGTGMSRDRKYESNSGLQYQYDLNRSSDQMRYDLDLPAQRRDDNWQLRPTEDMRRDRDLQRGERGGGIWR